MKAQKMLTYDQLSRMSKPRLIRILELGPQSVKPPRMHAQDKQDLARAITSAFRRAGPAYDAMLAAIQAERNSS